MFDFDLFQHLTDGLVIMDSERTILQLNPAAHRLTGWQIGEKVPHCTFCQKRVLQPGEERCILAGKEPVSYFESEMPTVYGENLPVAFSTTFLPRNNDRDRQMVLVIRDISKKRKEEEAKMAKLLARQTIEAQETERKRLVQELHDGIGQSLYSISIGLNGLLYSTRDQHLQTTLSDLLHVLNDTMNEVKRLSTDLRPTSLDMLGLDAALSSLISRIERHSLIAIEYQSTLDYNDRFSPHVELNLYRIIQEALNNIVKHSESQKALISIQWIKNREGLTINIEDERKGFPHGEAGKYSTGLGLKHIQERVNLLDGLLEIKSQIGKGTSLLITIPDVRKEMRYE
ncbi:MAG TPA: ATPase [Paenibacillaceae bacterium]|nr:ATPase [Paenibacillaceae bacterium]